MKMKMKVKMTPGQSQRLPPDQGWLRNDQMAQSGMAVLVRHDVCLPWHHRVVVLVRHDVCLPWHHRVVVLLVHCQCIMAKVFLPVTNL